jgi:hypothetical protein
MTQHTSEGCKVIGHMMGETITRGHDGYIHVRCSHCGAHGTLIYNAVWDEDEED